MRLSVCFTGFGPIAPTIPVVQAADQAGFDGVWMAEHVGYHDAVVSSTVYLQATQRLEIGLVGLTAASRHPVLMAMEVASLCELGPGRIRIQVGTGDPALIARINDAPLKHALQNVTALVDSLRSLFAGEVVNEHAPLFKINSAQLAPTTPPPAIDIMAIRPRMMALSARIGDGVSLGTCSSRSYMAESVQLITQELATHGRERSAFRVTAFSFVAIAPTLEEARARLAPLFVAAWSTFPQAAWDVLGGGVTVPDGATVVAALAEGGMEAALQLFTPEIIDALAFVSTPEELSTKLEAYIQTGIDELVCLFPLSDTPEMQAEQIRLLAAARLHAQEASLS
jgi:alkanesulfonate monooxygenase SsuD/methylene tetrahydromethanopterin reductase-like flavin-dependent oxidoreductase (luciferase family)